MTEPSPSMTGRAKAMTARESACLPAGKLSVVLSLLKAHGMDGRPLLQRSGLPLDILDDPEARIPLQTWIRLNHLAAGMLKDPDFGLHLGEVFEGMPTLLGYLLNACETIGEAMNKFMCYQRLEHEGWQLLEHARGPVAELEYQATRSAALDRHMIDFALSSIVRQYRIMTGHSLEVSEAHFSYARPDRIAEHQRILGSHLHFGSTRTALVFPAWVLNQPIVRASAAVRDHLEHPLRKALTALDHQELVSAKVARAVGSALRKGVPALRDIAKDLSLGPRSLQLRLQTEGTTFQRVLEGVRAGLAREYIADTSLTIQEAAFLLGFSEPSAFHRAFRRWTGRTPSEYRNLDSQRRESGA